MERKYALEYNPTLLVKFSNPTKEEVKTAIRVLDNCLSISLRDGYKKVLVDKLLINENKLLHILRIEPGFIRYIPKENQTLNMTKIILKKSPQLLNYCYKFNDDLIEKLPKQYAGIFLKKLNGNKINLSYNSAKRFVSSDGVLLQYIPEELHTLELVKLAIKNWAKSIRFSKLKNKLDIEASQIFAIEQNLQSFIFEPISEKVLDRYKELCIKGHYYPDNESLVNKLNFSQDDLYNMYVSRHQWINSYLIFRRLNLKNQKKLLSMLKVRSIKLDDLALLDSEMKVLLLKNGHMYSNIDYSEEDLITCIKYNPDLLDKFIFNPQVLESINLSDNFLKKVATFNKKALILMKDVDLEFIDSL